MENMSESEASSFIDHDLSTLTSKKYSESLTCDYEDLDSWLLRKKQPHIDEKELKRKNKRNASRSFESTDIRWYVGVVILSVYHCSLHL